MTREEKTCDDSRVELNQFMMPEHANLLGNVHGGIIMKLVDEAGALCAIRHAQRYAVTVAIDSMTFHDPVKVGDLLCLRAQMNYVGRTSMEVGIEVTAENPLTRVSKRTNSAMAVYVALGEDGHPFEVPRLALRTKEEHARADAARARQQRRLREAGS